MNKLKLFIIALIGCVMSAACGSDDEPTPSAPDYVSETIQIPAEGCDMVFSLQKLNSSEIYSMSARPDWLLIMSEPLNNSALKIRIIAKSNESSAERKATVTINDYYTLFIVQKAKKPEKPSDDPTDDPSDKPTEMGYNNNPSSNRAYAPKR